MKMPAQSSRNVGIDLFRCVLVLGIILYHIFLYNDHAYWFEPKIWTWCVPGFAFISGYYGVKFKLSKVVRLWTVAALCAIVPWAILRGEGSYLELFYGNWYLTAYTILILMSPIINAGLNLMHETKNYTPLVGVGAIAFWAWLGDMHFVRNFIPQASGIGALTFSSVFVAYVLAWTYREFPNVWSRISPWWLLPLIPAMAVFGHYDSPFALLFTVLLFSAFTEINLSPRLSAFARRVGEAGFAVYLIHANPKMLKLIDRGVSICIDEWHCPKYLAYLACALAVYFTCVLLYWFAVILLRQISPLYNRLLRRLDFKIIDR